MIRSMTAFARQEFDTDQGTLSWEIRSLNHRYLEIGLRLPEEVRVAEAAVRERINTRLGRGKVDCTCRYRPNVSAAVPVDIDEDNLSRLLAACETVGSRLPETVPLNPVELLRWPGVVTEQLRDPAPLHEAAMTLLEQAAEQLLAARGREGEQINHMVAERLAGIEHWTGAIRAWLPDIRQALHDRMRERVGDLGQNLEPERLAQEVAVLAQKMDVDEELDRLDAHVLETRRTLGLDEPVGRRLDFLMQEFNRESNTLSSKSVDQRTTQAAVELKVLIEQMREQVQNVE